MSSESEKWQHHNKVKRSLEVENIPDKKAETFSSSVDLQDLRQVEEAGTIPIKGKKYITNSQDGSKQVV